MHNKVIKYDYEAGRKTRRGYKAKYPILTNRIPFFLTKTLT